MSRVLVAEDEPQLLRLMERILERAGHEVVGACDGGGARACAGVDAVVIDARLEPDGAGPVLDALLASQPELALVVTSGDRIPAPLGALLEERGGVFLRKPFAPVDLVRALGDAEKP